MHRYRADLETQTVAAKLAHDFNQAISSTGLSAIKVKYLMARIARIPQPDGTHRYMFVEKKYRQGSSGWTKFTLNSGHFICPVKGKDAEYQQLLMAFSHFTHQHSRGYLLVCDLQGVENIDAKGHTLLLTDPAIHCDAMRFGRTNLRDKGIRSFFATHTCNKYCKGLRLRMPTFGSSE